MRDARGGAKGHDHDVGVLAHERLGTLLAGLHRLIALETLDVQTLQLIGGQVKGVDDVMLALALVPSGGPRLLRQLLNALGKHDGLHHLAEHAVGEDHGRHAVLVGLLEGQVRQIGHLLDGGRSEHEHLEIAMAHGAGGLPVVGLRGLDAAKARAAALHVDDDAGKVGARHIRDALALKRHARRRRRGHDARAGRRCSVDHVDSRDLAFGLQIRAAFLGHALGHVSGNLGLRRDGIAEEETASCADDRLRHGLVALHEHLFLRHQRITSIATSGHISAHEQQPVHLDASISRAG